MKGFYIFISSIFLLACSSHKPQFIGKPLAMHESPQTIGFDKSKQESLTLYLSENLSTTGMLILQDGKVVYSYGDVEEVSYIASCRKSVLSILYGKHVESGLIDLDESIGAIGIEEDAGLLESEKAATVHHVLNSRSGVFLEPVNKGYDEANILERGSVKPGEYFVYNNWDFNVAGAILEIKTGKSIYEELEEQLAIPLDFEDWNIKNQQKKFNKKKSRYPAYHMYLSTRDMAKIGQLMLNQGKWEGEQLISPAWIEKITKPVTGVDEVNQRYGKNAQSAYQFSYAYMWWLVESIKQDPNFEGAYTASGYGGQFITVIPKLNVVVAHKTKLNLLNHLSLKYDVANWQYWNLLYSYLGSDLRKN